MVLNKRGGNRAKRGKKQVDKKENVLELVANNPNCYYAIVTKRFGNNNFEIKINNKKITASIRGNMFKRVWIHQNDIVLVNLDLEKYIIVHKYTPEEAKQLRVMGEINFDETIFGDEENANVKEKEKAEGQEGSDHEFDDFIDMEPKEKQPVTDNKPYNSNSDSDLDSSESDSD